MLIDLKSGLAILAAQIFFATPTLSAEFGLVKAHFGHLVTLDGQIEKGDADRFRAIMRKAIFQPVTDMRPEPFQEPLGHLTISLDSQGGNVDEAIEISKIVRSTLAATRTAFTSVWPRDINGKITALPSERLAFANLDEPLPALSGCLSACTIILFGGVQRTVFDNSDNRTNDATKTTFYPTIGVHRPSFVPEEYAQLSPTEAQKAYNRMLKDMSDALAEMGAPHRFIERTMATPSTEIDYISSDEMEHLVAEVEPFFDEWLAAKCGRPTDPLNDEERKLHRRYQQVWADRLKLVSWAEIKAWDEDVALVKEFGLKDAGRAKDVSKKVNLTGRRIDSCVSVTVQTVRYTWATEAR